MGGYNDDTGRGAIWIYTQNNSVWSQKGSKLVAAAETNEGLVGISVSLSSDGNTLIAGAPEDSLIGAAYAFYAAGIPVIVGIKDIPYDQGGNVGIKWTKSAYDNVWSNPPVTSYTIWRALPGGSATPGAVGSPTAVPIVPGKHYRKMVFNGTDYYWEMIGTQPAHFLQDYGFDAPTYSDSISGSNGMEQFFVSAETDLPTVFYDSNVDTGYSVDNIPPVPPAGVTATAQAGPVARLTWNPPTDPDVGHYDIYRSTVTGFTPAPGLKTGTSNTYGYIDSSVAAGSGYHYRIIAVDIHGNQSQPSARLWLHSL